MNFSSSEIDVVSQALLRLQPRTQPDRRRHRRIPMPVSGRLLDHNQQEHFCRTVDLSAGGALLELAGDPAPLEGAPVVIYLEHLGRLPAKVVSVRPEDQLAVQLTISQTKRERIVEFLTARLANYDPDAEAAPVDFTRRRAMRYPGSGELFVETDDGRRIACEALDFSLLGIAVKAAGLRPALGAWVRVGAAHGRVTRYLEGGFAIDFAPRPKD